MLSTRAFGWTNKVHFKSQEKWEDKSSTCDTPKPGNYVAEVHKAQQLTMPEEEKVNQ